MASELSTSLHGLFSYPSFLFILLLVLLFLLLSGPRAKDWLEASKYELNWNAPATDKCIGPVIHRNEASSMGPLHNRDPLQTTPVMQLKLSDELPWIVGRVNECPMPKFPILGPWGYDMDHPDGPQLNAVCMSGPQTFTVQPSNLK